MLTDLLKLRQRQILKKILFLLNTNVNKSLFEFIQRFVTLLGLIDAENFYYFCKDRRLFLMDFIQIRLLVDYFRKDLLLESITIFEREHFTPFALKNVLNLSNVRHIINLVKYGNKWKHMHSI